MANPLPAILTPLAEPPGLGDMLEVAPRVFWARMPLPMTLDHVNVYAIDDAEGWDDHRHGHQLNKIARYLEKLIGRSDGLKTNKAGDCNASSPRSCGPCRMVSNGIWGRLMDDAHGVVDGADAAA